MAFNLGSVTDFVGGVVENASEFPEWLRGQADTAESELIDKGQQFQDQLSESGNQVEDNLKESRAAGTGANFGRWLSKPKNLILSGVLLVAVVWGLTNFKAAN